MKNYSVIIHFYLKLNLLTFAIVFELEIGNNYTHIMTLLCHLLFIYFFTEVLVQSNICFLTERECVLHNISMICISTKFLEY